MQGTLNCKLVGFSNFNSKDKTKVFFTLQCLYTEADKSKNLVRSKILDVFVDETTFYSITSSQDIYSDIEVSFTVNLGSDKIFYSINS